MRSQREQPLQRGIEIGVDAGENLVELGHAENLGDEARGLQRRKKGATREAKYDEAIVTPTALRRGAASLWASHLCVNMVRLLLRASPS